MEPDIRAFLILIVQSMSIMVLWLLANTLVGIKWGYLFLDEGITVWHGVYYIGMVASFIWVLRYIIKKWKRAPKFEGTEKDI